MAYRLEGQYDESHAATQPPNIENCHRGPEFPIDEATQLWLRDLVYVWGRWKRSEAVTNMLHGYFATTSNPFSAVLDLMCNCEDFRLAKTTSLAYTVMEEFSRWISPRYMSYQHCLTNEVKLTAFDRMIKQRNLSLVKLIIDVYKMTENADIFLDPLHCLINVKQYKEACNIAAMLNLHRHFTLEDFLIPLVFQDKTCVAEEFLRDSPSHQQAVVGFLDDLLGKRNIGNEVDKIIEQLNIPNTYGSKLYFKPLSKLVARLTKLYNLPPTSCPNLNQKRNEGALQFLIHKRFQENGLGVESWREMAREAVGSNSRLQCELVSSVAPFDPGEAYYFANEFGIPKENWPYALQNYVKQTIESKTAEGASQVVQGEEENWDSAVSLEFHTLSLSKDDIVLVDSQKTFEDFVRYILTNNVSLVGIDTEWKPFFGTKKNELALIQIATKNKVYILDVMTIANTYEDLWKQLGDVLFINEKVMKLGFGLHADAVMIKHSLPHLGTVFQSGGNNLDLLLLWKSLVKDHSFVFPYPENTVTSGESLTRLVELCLGRPLDKSDQFSNWERRPLRPSQIVYAALDAYCLLEVYEVFQQYCLEQGIPFFDVVQEVLSNKKSPKKSTKISRRGQKDEESVLEVGPQPFPEPISPSQLKVVCDTTVEGLGKHLRICGVDTVFIGSNEHHDKCVRIANQQGRMVITRGRNMWKKLAKHLPAGYCYPVLSDKLDDQLKEVLQYFNVVLTKDDVFSRCKLCNGNEFARVSQATMKKLLASYQRMSNSSTVEDDDSKWDYEGFSSESDACSDEGTSPPTIHSQWQQTSEIIENVDVGRCLTRKGLTIQVHDIPLPRLEELSEFNVCETCGKCYWDGTHLGRYMNSTLRNLI